MICICDLRFLLKIFQNNANFLKESHFPSALWAPGLLTTDPVWSRAWALLPKSGLGLSKNRGLRAGPWPGLSPDPSLAKSFLIWYISMEIFLGWYADWIMENICRLIHNTIRFFVGVKKKTRLWKGAKTCWRISKASDSIRNENFGNFFPYLASFCYFEKFKIGMFFSQCLSK